MENAHIVGRFDKDLDKLKKRILAMGALVDKQLKGATNALHTPDREAIDLLVAEDRKVNGMNRSIAGRAERLIALRQPVALDLRAALLPINIAAELERIGDHAKSTAKRARKLDLNSIPREPIDLLTQMSRITQAQLTDAMVAYRDSDIDLVDALRARDAEVDALNKTLFDLAVNTLSNADHNAETILNIILIARNFERVGDRVVNIARHVNQIVTGDDLKATQ
jgi:phosphate transport system protein